MSAYPFSLREKAGIRGELSRNMLVLILPYPNPLHQERVLLHKMVGDPLCFAIW